ncbi:hypothetical protein ATANTOWER_014679 [Ataeniobius toweri]|uniref:Ubiquitin-like domain-containing protein n=1 Tax=Ataeniobius toweri TaxID=208326 RepID=A0ABU7AYP0_9TELE|nr:hypothetical protein [Ataeniobius toweri]
MRRAAPPPFTSSRHCKRGRFYSDGPRLYCRAVVLRTVIKKATAGPVKMLIKVKTLTGKEIEIDIEPTDKVERIKERVEEKEGIPPQQQRLIYSGKQM